MTKELAKCIGCPRPTCNGCPAGTNVGEIMALVKAGDRKTAARKLFQNNPLSAITGRVCPNHLYCQPSCVLHKRGGAPSFNRIERTISGRYLTALSKSKRQQSKLVAPNPNPLDILIVGGGAAGLAAAFYLRFGGHNVTLTERKSHLGGMMYYGIPSFRLDKSPVAKLETVLVGMGVTIRKDTPVDLSQVADLRKQYHHIVWASGAHKSNSLGIPGEQLATSGLDFLATAECVGEHVAVIGGGNVAIDCALTARRGGATVTQFYRKGRENLKCYDHEFDAAKRAGVKFMFHHAPTEITATHVTFDTPDGTRCVPADRAIVAIGQKPEPTPTPDAQVHVIGDAATGTQTIIKAVAAAKELCGRIDNLGKQRVD